MAVKKIRSEISWDRDTGEAQLCIYLGTTSEGAAKIKAQRLILAFNNALKPKGQAKHRPAEHGSREAKNVGQD